MYYYTFMTEYHYQATGKFLPRGMGGDWTVSGSYTEGSQVFSLGNSVKSLVYLDSGLTNYLSYKHGAPSIFTKGQTFSCPLTVKGSDGTTLATPTFGYNVTKCTYTLTDGDWTRGGGYLAALVKALLSEKYSLTVADDYECDLGTFQVTTFAYQPRGAASTTVVSKPTDTKPAPKPVEKKPEPEPEDVFAGGMDIFGNSGADKGDY
jgi:hypothetical protein